jgi:hypothetical protein
MPLVPQAPYDSLATITQMVRALLGDFIQNLQPNNTGVVNVNAGGLSIAWVSGNQFTAPMNSVAIVINGVPNTIVMVTSPTTATLLNPAAVAAGVTYSLVIPTGDFFADSQAYVLPVINLAYRKVQKKLADKGHPRAENVIVLTGLPPVANLDPAIEQYMNWTSFYDGANLWTPAVPPPSGLCPVLPQDFISPLKLEERQNVSGATPTNPNLNVMRPMHPAGNGLFSRAKGSYNRYFDWREDAIYFNGSLFPMDVKARYAAYLIDIAVAAGGFGSTPVPILGAAESIANYAAAIFVTPRGSLLGPSFDAAGDMALSQITNANAKLQQRASYSRIAWGQRGRRRARNYRF